MHSSCCVIEQGGKEGKNSMEQRNLVKKEGKSK
jgi:hypothetical protein